MVIDKSKVPNTKKVDTSLTDSTSYKSTTLNQTRDTKESSFIFEVSRGFVLTDISSLEFARSPAGHFIIYMYPNNNINITVLFSTHSFARTTYGETCQEAIFLGICKISKCMLDDS